jgi:hypothetical protein
MTRSRSLPGTRHRTKQCTKRRTKYSGVLFCWALARALSPLSSARAADAEPAPSGWAAALGEADRRFVAGDLAGAREVLQPVCSSSDRPECAFALGAIEHGLGHCEAARVHYQHYRELAPRGEHLAEVEAALEEVEAQCGNAPSPPAAVAVPAAPLPGTPPLVEATAASAPSPVAAPAPLPPVPVAPAHDPLRRSLVIGSLALSGAAAVTSVVFGVLAAQSADHCQQATVYDRGYREECEEQGPSYQGLWQGFAVASGALLGVGLTLWWLDARSSAAIGVAAAGTPTLQYRRNF